MYGLSKHDLEFISQKINFQKNYLKDNYFTTSSGQVKTLLDVSYSANHSERYYAQLANKINTMTDYSKNYDLEPIFITITLDGFYRDFLNADFSRFNKKDFDERIEIFKTIPNNEIYGYLHDKIENNEAFTIKDLYNVLNYQYKKFLSSYVFKKMLKNEHKYMYIRTAEPHKKDGVPHFHIMLYIKPQYLDGVQSSYDKYFPAHQNQKEGFIKDINNPSGYILKYITKSFMDIKNQNDIDYIQAWYIKHRIMRCVTSKFTVPQWIYQKCYAIEKDWNYLTDFMYNDNKIAEWSFKDDYFHLIDYSTDREIIYDKGVIKLIREDRLLKTFGVKKEKIDIFSKVPKKFIRKTQFKQIDVLIDNKPYKYYKGTLLKVTKKPYEMELLELYNYFYNLDIESCDEQHYIVTRNLMIQKGLLDGELVNTTAIQDMYLEFEAEGVF